ncbi:MAG: hypothetical protein KA734_11455 [Fluviicola sp.]|nr:hypothetical protein [Fluviicola sp.]
MIALGLKFQVINPLEDKKNLIYYLEFDLWYEKDGYIKKINPKKYCSLLEHISKNKSFSCEENLNFWRKEYTNDRIKINSGLKPKSKLSIIKKKLEDKVVIWESIFWGLLLIYFVSTFIRSRK